jgi:L-seryl-tRNA(Ser) seleniumtransferase
VTGFTETVAVEELADLCDTHGVPLIYDIGSGLLDASVRWVPDWLGDEPGASQAIQAGAGIVTFSGDKLLGGPQAGLLVGRQSLVEKIRSHPLARSLRVDGVTYAALSATLTEYLEGEPNGIPFWAMALTDGDTLRRRCEKMGEMIGSRVEEGASAVGAGSAPGVEIPTPVLRVVGGHEQFECLLDGDPPILARREAGDLIIDLRAVDPEDDRAIADRLLKCL